MRCLSLWQPWASLVVHGLKRVETRHGKFRIQPGPLLIHAAKKWDDDLAALCETEPFAAALASAGITLPGVSDGPPSFEMPFGAVIGVVNVLAMTPTDSVGFQPAERYIAIDGPGKLVVGTWEKAFGDYSPGRVAILTEAGAVTFPHGAQLPVAGRQGLFDVPDELVAPLLAGWKAANAG